jgi:acyl-lipid omega-6 desaturase (Delta-12 desaturase)
MATSKDKQETEGEDWKVIVSKYNYPDTKRSIWQLINSIVPFFGIWTIMYLTIDNSYWITLGLAFLAAGFMVRIFIIFHDCGHKSFFKSSGWNEAVGFFTGLFTFNPYYKWQLSHNKHHATVGNLDKRGTGDVMTMTVGEFKMATKGRKLFYRIYRNPVVMFGVAAPLIFLLQNRFFSKDASSREKRNVLWTNLAVVIIITSISMIISFKTFLLIQLPILYIASVWGVWLFYVQHQYVRVHWYRNEEWDYKTVALMGSSYYKLPKLLQWFSGNIGFHHIHHLSSRIPNYKLARCHAENKMFRSILPLTFRESLKSLKMKLWDEKSQRLVSFTEASQPA